ncbi:MAG: hypothetical protein GX862_00130 [Leucobacter sp.]|nr:hypothetical protein [Leucobacter sp.]
MQKRVSLRGSIVTFIAASACALLFTGCQGAGPSAGPAGGEPEGAGSESAAAEQQVPAEETASGRYTATLSAGDREFTFAPSTCIINDEDVVVSGPGADDATGEPAFLSIDLYTATEPYQGEVRVDLGTDQEFESSDDLIVAFIGSEHGSQYVRASNDSMVLTVGEFRDGNAGTLGSGRVIFNCAAR